MNAVYEDLDEALFTELRQLANEFQTTEVPSIPTKEINMSHTIANSLARSEVSEVVNFTNAFLTDKGAVNKATTDYQAFNPALVMEQEGKDKADPADKAVPSAKLVIKFQELFTTSITNPAKRADEAADKVKVNKNQMAYGSMLGLSPEECKKLESEANVIVQAAKDEVTQNTWEVDPLVTIMREKLGRAFLKANLSDCEVPRELAKTAYKKRAESNAFAIARKTDESRKANEELKVVFNAFNTASRAVVWNAGRAIAKDTFQNNSFREEFHFEGKSYSINKSANQEELTDALWNADDVFFGESGDVIRASFDQWKTELEPVYLGLIGLREDHRYSSNVTITHPSNFDALSFLKMTSTVDRSYTELEYTNYSLETQVEDELNKLKVQFAIEAKKTEFLGGSSFSSSIDF